MDYVESFVKYSEDVGKKWTELKRETYRNYRIPRQGGICFSHLDTEPCAECWIP